MAAQFSLARARWRHEPPARSVSSADGVVHEFEAVYAQHFNFVWSSTRRLGVHDAALDDVVQEIFLVIHARLHTLEKAASLRSWIYGVVRRVVSDHHRSQRTNAASAALLAVELEGYASLTPTPLELAEQNDQAKLLRTSLESIEPRQREVFMLAELEQMTGPEVADALAIPLNTVYSRLRAARVAFEAAVLRHVARQPKRG
jgi:RNA polymerase sigma-70 factor (ECF subfamily)